MRVYVREYRPIFPTSSALILLEDVLLTLSLGSSLTVKPLDLYLSLAHGSSQGLSFIRSNSGSLN